MGNLKTPASLKWLIDKRARISGEIKKLDEILPTRLESLKSSLEEAESRYKIFKHAYKKNLDLFNTELPKLKSQLAAIDIALGIHEVKIDTSLIGPIRPQYAKCKLPYGTITRNIYQYLKITKSPTTTKEIVRFISEKNQVDHKALSFVKLTDIVAKRLKTLSKQGKIKRLHDLKTSNEGIWMMTSLDIERSAGRD